VPIISVKAKRKSVATATIISAKPHLRGQFCSQYADVAVVSLRSAELIANLSLHGIPGFRAVRRRKCDHFLQKAQFAAHPLPQRGVPPLTSTLAEGREPMLVIITGEHVAVCDPNHNPATLSRNGTSCRDTRLGTVSAL
jgi:hypothetical protein